MNEWFKSSYRRSLVDMHIHDWNDKFLSEFDIDKYFEYLKVANVDSAMIYLQSHVGLCYYPTKSGVMHKAFVGKEDMMKRLIDRCRAEGIYVVGYYSLIYNTVEEDRHPEWKIVCDRLTGSSHHFNGSRYGMCCPNNAQYREFLKVQVKELADYFTLDGIFFDMTFWPKICYCEQCRARFEAETGIATLPDMDDLKAENAMLFLRKRYEWIVEFAEWITAYTREVMPNVTVSHNNANSVAADWKVAVCEGISDVSEYSTGDLYGDAYMHSFAMKYYQDSTQNMPFEYMTSRFAVNLAQHTLSKSLPELMRDTLLGLAHHGANFIIDAIDPVGTLNMKVGELIGAAYKNQMPYEKYAREAGDCVGDVAVWYSTTGRYNTEGQDFQSRICAGALAKTLINNHVPFKVMGNTATGRMSKYKVILAPAIAGLTDAHRADIYEYVRNGGTFWFSGVEDEELLREFFGASREGFTTNKHTYVAPVNGRESLLGGFDSKYPLAMKHRHPIVRGFGEQAEILAYLNMPCIDENDPMHFASIHSNPPWETTDVPSVVRAPYGKGTVIWSALPIEGYDSRHHREVTMSILREYLPESEQTVVVSAPAQVEVIAFKTEDSIYVSFADIQVTSERLKMPPFSVSVATQKAPKRVLILPAEADVPFKYEDGRVTFGARELDIFDMYKIEL